TTRRALACAPAGECGCPATRVCRLGGVPLARPYRDRTSSAKRLPRVAVPCCRLERYLEQFPWVDNGLNRTERQILSLIDAGHRTFPALFRADQQTEPWIFMGDTSYRYYLTGIMTCPHPLVEEIGGKYRVTQTGREVQSGRADHIRLNGINRWLGGVHLEGSEARWRWSEAKRRLIPH